MRPAALDRLHDFYRPPPPSGMPQTTGWYVVFALLFVLAVWLAWRLFARWRHNRYRREALRELEHATLSVIPTLLKRTALAAWPREEVAGLSGEPWLEFLEQTGGAGTRADADLLDLDYRGTTLTPEQEKAVRHDAAGWIRRHRVRV